MIALWIVLHYAFASGYGDMSDQTVKLWIIADLLISPILGLLFKWFVRLVIQLSKNINIR